MSWLLILGLKNALLVIPLAFAALVAGRLFRRPALAHVLWVLVLVKLVTPPLIDVPVGWSIDVSPWLAGLAEVEGPVVGTGALQLDAQTNAAADNPALSGVGDSGSLASVSVQCPEPAATSSSAPAVDFAAADCASAAPSAGWLPGWLWLPRSAADWLAIVGCVWLSGSAVAATLLLRRAMRFHRFLRLAARDDQRLLGRVRQLAYSVGLIRPPAVVVVEGVVSPMLWGLGNRVQLVFPARLAERLAPSEIDALLLHELAHYARGDYWVRLLELVAHVAYWWHPVVWWTRREIESAEEQCCDAWVVEHQRGTRLSYAEALLATIDFLCEPATPLPPAACGLGEVPLIKSRLTQIMRGELGGQLSRTVWVTILGAGLILSPLEPAVFATSSRERLARVGPASDVRASIPTSADDPESPAPSLEKVASTAAPVSLPASALVLGPPDVRPASFLLASAQSPDGNFQLEARTGRQVTLSHRDSNFRLGLSSDRFTCAAFAPDSRWFVSGHEDGHVKLWDSMTGVSLATLRVGRSWVVSVEFSPSGELVAAGDSSGTVSVWELTTQNQIATLANPEIAVSCVRWSPDGSRLAVSLGSWTSQDARLILWDPAEGRVESEESLPRPIGALEWLSADTLLLADWEGVASVRLPSSEQSTLQFQLDKNLVTAARWSPDDRGLITAASRYLSGNAR